MRKAFAAVCLFWAVALCLSAEEKTLEQRRKDTILYGTDTEILNLVTALEKEGADYLDADLVAVLSGTKNGKLLTTVFGYLERRKKGGAEARAVQCLTDWDTEDHAAVEAALSYIAAIGWKDAVPALRKLLEEGDESFASSAIRALGRCGGEAEATYLLDYVKAKERGENIEDAVIGALGYLKSKAALPWLHDMIDNEDTKPTRVMSVLEALKRIGAEESKPFVLKALKNADSSVRASAVSALGPFSGADVDGAILESFRDSFYKARAAACIAAADRKLASALPYLEYRALQDEVPVIREEAARSMGKIGGPDALGKLKSFVENPKTTAKVKILSAEALLGADGPAYVGTVAAAMDKAKTDKDLTLYSGLAKAISGVKDASLEARTRAFLQSKDVVDRHYGLDLVIVNKFASMRELVEPMTKDRNESLARKAKIALEAIGGPSPSASTGAAPAAPTTATTQSLPLPAQTTKP